MARLNILKLRAVAPVAPAPEPVQAPPFLCRGCVWSHVVEGHAGEWYVLCGFNGVLRDLPFSIARCTDYRGRSERAVVGFGAGI
jgi:hypothetical protein